MQEEKTIQLTIAPDVQVLCDLLDITPEQLLNQYMRDLCSMALNGGSDERLMAKQYFLRTHLSSQSVFSNDCATEICEDFETIYQSAYPAVGNTGWEQQRTELLTELHNDWKLRKEAVTE
jgi:hypothetical protein